MISASLAGDRSAIAEEATSVMRRNFMLLVGWMLVGDFRLMAIGEAEALL